MLSSAFLHLCDRSLTAAAGFALGDVVAQHSTKPHGERYNYLRTARMTAFGLFFAGPLQGHYWYGWLDKVSPMHDAFLLQRSIPQYCAGIFGETPDALLKGMSRELIAALDLWIKVIDLEVVLRRLSFRSGPRGTALSLPCQCERMALKRQCKALQLWQLYSTSWKCMMSSSNVHAALELWSAKLVLTKL